jgi:hypothetical protein
LARFQAHGAGEPANDDLHVSQQDLQEVCWQQDVQHHQSRMLMFVQDCRAPMGHHHVKNANMLPFKERPSSVRMPCQHLNIPVQLTLPLAFTNRFGLRRSACT